MIGRVLSPGESMTVFTPRDPENNPLVFRQIQFALGEDEKEREQIEGEICYGSTLGECWILRGGGGRSRSSTKEGRGCPGQSATSFEQ
jgi:hypothetical protein